MSLTVRKTVSNTVRLNSYLGPFDNVIGYTRYMNRSQCSDLRKKRIETGAHEFLKHCSCHHTGCRGVEHLRPHRWMSRG